MKGFQRLLTSAFLIIAVLALGARAAHASIAFVAGSETHNYCNSTTSCSVSIYSSVANNQVVVFNLHLEGNPEPTDNSGFTGVPAWMTCPKNAGNILHCYGVWTTGDSTSFTISSTTATNYNFNYGAAVWSGEDPANPVDPNGTGEMVAFNPSPASIPAIGPAYLNEMRIGFLDSPYHYQGGGMGTPSGFTVRSSYGYYNGNGGFEGIYEQALTTTAVQATAVSNNTSGVTVYGGGILLRPASAVSGTQTPTPYIACIGEGGDITDCQAQTGDLSLLCGQQSNASSPYSMSQMTNPPGYTTIGRQLLLYGGVSTNTLTAKCVQHTLASTELATNISFGANANFNRNATYGALMRVPNGGHAVVAYANTKGVPGYVNLVTGTSFTSAQIVSALTGDYFEYFTSDYAGVQGFTAPTATLTNTIGQTTCCTEVNSFWGEADETAAGTFGGLSYTVTNSADQAGVSFFVAGQYPSSIPIVQSSTGCGTTGPATSLTCTPGSGTATTDEMLATIYANSNACEAGLTAPTGWTLLSCNDNNPFGAPALVAGNTSFQTLGDLTREIVTKNTVAPSGTASYSIHACFRTRPGWVGGGGLIADDLVQNGTNDNVDRGLRMNTLGQIMFSHGATSTVWSGATTITSTPYYNDGFRHCTAGVYDSVGGKMHLYVDGVEQGGTGTTPTTANVTIPSSGYWVLGMAKNPPNYYGGPFEEGEFAEWDGVALTLANVQSIDLPANMDGGGFNTAMAALSPTNWWHASDSGPTAGAANLGSASTNAGIYNNMEGILGATSDLVGMGGMSPWFGGEMLLATNSLLNGPGILESTTDTVNTSAYTLEAVAKIPNGFTGGGFIAGYSPDPNGESATYPTYLMYVGSDGKLYCGIDCYAPVNHWFTFGGGTVVNDGMAHQLDCSWKGGVAQAYVDASTSGASSSSCTTPVTPSNPSQYFTVGTGILDTHFTNSPQTNSAASGVNGGAIVGEFSRVGLYVGANALTSTQISTHHSHIADGLWDSTALGDSPLHYLKMNETHGRTIADYGSAASTFMLNAHWRSWSWQVYAKTRTASESAVNFPLGDSVNAAGAILDISNIGHTEDATRIYAGGPLDGNAVNYPVSSSDANAIQVDLIGYGPRTASPTLWQGNLVENVIAGAEAAGPTTPDKALNLDGSTNFVTTKVGGTHFVDNSFSLLAGFSCTGAGGTMIELGSNQTSPTAGGQSWAFPLLSVDTTGHVVCGRYGGANDFLSSTTASYCNGSPHIAVCTYDGTTFSVYVDSNTAQATSTDTSHTAESATVYLALGAGVGNGSSPTIHTYFPGVEGQAAYFSGVTLNTTQIGSLITHQLDGSWDTTLSGLSPTYWWKGNDTALPIVVDSAGSNTGTYYGTAPLAITVQPMPFNAGPSNLSEGAYIGASGLYSTGLELIMPEATPPPPPSSGALYFREED